MAEPVAAAEFPTTAPVAVPAPPGFEPWYRAEHGRVLRVVTALLDDVQAAQDVTAEAFARALAQWDRVSQMGKPSGWVYTVAVNLARRRARRSALERRVLGSGRSRIHAVTWFEGDQQAAETWDAVRALPPRQRLAVVLRYLEDLPEAEIAAVMGVSPGTVAATLHAARRRLAESWSNE
jgi:RNA polymerase sigma-70 factor, ECF subfamily